MFKVTAHHSNGTPISIEIRTEEFATREEAVAVAAIFPKSLLAKTTRCGYVTGSDGVHKPDTYACVIRVTLLPTKLNPRNEAGIKRYRSFRRVAEKNNMPVRFVTYGNNGTWNEEELEAVIA